MAQGLPAPLYLRLAPGFWLLATGLAAWLRAIGLLGRLAPRHVTLTHCAPNDKPLVAVGKGTDMHVKLKKPLP